MSKNTRTYHVQGMHCQACELLVEKQLLQNKFVKSAQASLTSKTVTLRCKSPNVTLGDLNASLADIDYSLSESPVGIANWSLNTILTATVVLFSAIFLYLFAESQGYLAQVQVSQNSSLVAFLFFGIIAGISSCAALTGGLLLSLSKKWNGLYGGQSTFRRSVPFIMFNVGRIVSYTIFGGLLGLVGSFLGFSITATSGLIVIVSVIMLILGLQMLGVPWVSGIRLQLPHFFTRNLASEKNFQGKYMPFLAGAGTFFLPCGFTLIVQSIALATGDFAKSAMIMFAFALGTLPGLALISIGSIKFQVNSKFAGSFNLTAGVLIVIFSLYNLNSQFLVLGIPNTKTVLSRSDSNAENDDGSNPKVVTENGIQKQYAYIQAEGFKYFPKSLNLQAGVPTTLSVKTSNVVGCAQAMYLKGLYDEVVYLNKPEVEVQFTPEKGKYYISCTMGMVDPIVVNVI